jgi:hypothetical protein
MNALCSKIATENDYDRFTELVHELNELLERKEHRLEYPPTAGISANRK